MLCENMKVVVQNGCDHALTRKEVEAMIPLFPTGWKNKAISIVLYQGDAIESIYHEKENIFGLFCPKNNKNIESKEKVVEELLLGLACISDKNKPPNHLNRSERNYYLDKTMELKAKCFGVIAK